MLGDPTEVALLAAAESAGVSVSDVRATAVRILADFPFDHTRRRISVIYQCGVARRLALKGSPEAVLALCSHVLQDGQVAAWNDAGHEGMLGVAEAMVGQRLRVLAVAERDLDAEDANTTDVEAGLTVVGLLGWEDPPRPEVPSAIASLKRAGVRVLMLTGDHPATARAIAERVGIDARQVVVGAALIVPSWWEVLKLSRWAGYPKTRHQHAGGAFRSR